MIAFRQVIYLIIATLFFALTANASPMLEGDYHGKLKINGLPLRNGVLYIREILKDAKSSSLVAVLAAENPDGNVGEILPYHFDAFIALSDTSGEFSLRRLPNSVGVGTEVVTLMVVLHDSNRLHGILSGNMISSTGALIEANFEFQRDGSMAPAT